jgi:hypothetical protein
MSKRSFIITHFRLNLELFQKEVTRVPLQVSCCTQHPVALYLIVYALVLSLAIDIHYVREIFFYSFSGYAA